MANEINTGSEKLLTRILADAQADAENIARESAAEVEAILNQGEKNAAAERARAEERRKRPQRRSESAAAPTRNWTRENMPLRPGGS